MCDLMTVLTIMSYNLILLVVLLLTISVKQEAADLIRTYRKFVYQKDMSEYCRRGVMPSVFLGRQVVDANSKILHFARLEVPYSCNINVRTEMGSNIIVVIQVITDIDLEKTCKQGNNQLVIYEMGETFGGYWGQVPDSVMKRGRRRNDRTYTLQTKAATPPITTTESTTPGTSTEKPTASPEKDPISSEEEREHEGEYFTVELPILNVSARIVPGTLQPLLSTTQDNFDFVYDVTPRSQVSYDTQLLPLLEINVKKNEAVARQGNDSDDFKFQVQFNDLFTPDTRLLNPQFRPYKGISNKYPYNVNSRFNFNKNKQILGTKERLFSKKYRRPKLNFANENDYISKLNSVKSSTMASDNEIEHKPNSWNVIHDILRNLSNTREVQTRAPHEELANILHRFSGSNASVYFVPNISKNEPVTSVLPNITRIAELITELRTTTKKPSGYNPTPLDGLRDTLSTSVSQDSNKSFNESDVLNYYNFAHNNGSSVVLLPLAIDIDSIILNVTNKMEDKFKNKSIIPKSATTATVSSKMYENLYPKNIFEYPNNIQRKCYDFRRQRRMFLSRSR